MLNGLQTKHRRHLETFNLVDAVVPENVTPNLSFTLALKRDGW